MNESEGSSYWRLYAALRARHAVTDYSERCHHFPCPTGFAAWQSTAHRVAFTEYSERRCWLQWTSASISCHQESHLTWCMYWLQWMSEEVFRWFRWIVYGDFSYIHLTAKIGLLITVNVMHRVITFTDYSEYSVELADLTYWLQWTFNRSAISIYWLQWIFFYDEHTVFTDYSERKALRMKCHQVLLITVNIPTMWTSSLLACLLLSST